MRPEILFPLFAGITSIPGIGPKTKEHYLRLTGNDRVLDILYHRPIGIIDRRKMPPLSQIQHGVVITAIVKIDAHIPPKNRNSNSPYKVICSNKTGGITLLFFNAFPDYIRSSLPIGQTRVISGRVETFGGSLQMAHPDYILPESRLNEVLRIEPVYPLTAGLGQRAITKTIREAIKKTPQLPEWLSTETLSKNNWLSWKKSIEAIHNPTDEFSLSLQGKFLKRLAYDEILAHQLTLKLNRKILHKQKGRIIKGDGHLQQALLNSLPFQLTEGQIGVIKEIHTDQASQTRMARMLQGDVGSGKTVVALIAALNTVEAGAQVAIMAPTEILANQHYKWISSILTPSPLGRWLGRGSNTDSAEETSRKNLYSPELLEFARELRGNQTDVEKKLWHLLRNKRFFGYKFYREVPIGNYIADFVCKSEKLIIELDGGQHATQKNYDQERTEFLTKQGFKVIRFWNNELNESLEVVLLTILSALRNESLTMSPNTQDTLSPPLSQSEREPTIALLTSSTRPKERTEILQKLASGEINILIGTHALFQEKVIFKDLGLVVIDEQHRFGVKQRASLAEKGENTDILIMTATPIPRSLTMAIYGDMECSRLTEKPVGRKPIDTRVIPASKIGSVVDGLKRVIAKGEKIYWICPLIEESEKSELAAVEERYNSFKQIFGDKVAVIHGRMKTAEREATMLKFRDGNVDILIATTVIEVGVDVPNATTIIIEHAEHFGLSQLHQLRGRVGRSDKQSTCILLYSTLGEIAAQRLSIMRDSNDGFRLAEEDLKIRGGGDVLGEKQSGLPSFKFANLYEHRDLFTDAGNDAASHLEIDPYFQSSRGKALRLLFQIFEYDLQEKMPLS